MSSGIEPVEKGNIVTPWTIKLTDGRTAQVEALEITTRQDGSLWVLAATAPNPSRGARP